MFKGLINNLLKFSSDLYKIDQTPVEVRTKAFEYLIQFYQKKVVSNLTVFLLIFIHLYLILRVINSIHLCFEITCFVFY